MPLFLASVFLSAFLLFQVQPVIARYILPWYGGSPGVWTTCLLFFQVGLLAGYAYAHALATFLRHRPRLQTMIHGGLLLLALATLPVTPDPGWKPDGGETHPAVGIVRLLALTVGFPYLLLSASGPLLQHWFAGAFPDRSPYRLYAVSNLGSLLGLLTYPFFFEPLLDLKQQTTLWSGAFVLYALLAGGTALLFVKRGHAGASDHPGGDPAPRVPRVDPFLWIGFSACGSMLLLSLTNQMCQDVAVVPFLWVLPLSLYLLSFVIAFDHERWYWRPLAIPLAAAGVGLTVWLMNRQYAATEWPLAAQVAIYCGALFFACLACHGEVVRIKPDPRHLTGFYLCISLGGALGGAFVSVAAPRLFDGYWELHLALELLALLLSVSLWRKFRRTRRPVPVMAGASLWIAALMTMVVFLGKHRRDTLEGSIAIRRGFYGVLKVEQTGDGPLDFRSLHHGRISHGRQYPFEERLATTYYSRGSGVGAVFDFLAQQTRPARLHVGVVGLGVGTIATYAESGDRFRFYEINPQVEDFARTEFTYLSGCAGKVEVVLGDARISMERELAAGRAQGFDVLFVDAFSGDSIPVHLMTREAFALYFQHLVPGGVLALHVTNLHLDLADPVRNLAAELGCEALRVSHVPDPVEEDHAYYSDWILVTKNPELDRALRESGQLSPWDREEARPILWTDAYSNLFEVAF